MHLLLIRVASCVFLLASAVVVVATLATFTLTARDDLLQSSEPTATHASTPQTGVRPRPPGVPGAAQLVTDDTTFGDVSTPSPGVAMVPHLFFWLTCDEHLLTIATTQETVYAELDCRRYWLVHEVVRPYQGQPVRVRISTGPPGVLAIEARTAGAARFEVDAVWIQTR